MQSLVRRNPGGRFAFMEAAASERLNMTDIGKIEYRVRPVTRYVVTRFCRDTGNGGGIETKGEYDNEQVAYEIGYALCRSEHESLGFPPGDERVVYPESPGAKPKLSLAAALFSAGYGSGRL